ncbi:thiopurine S-methyltransferase [Thalassotalea crassostreae]|uniref:thiopurine S-methyltransferase n=1 Tax=Thalassotalea crassostreae TaxID=1763536 RepID=UPI000838D158|nr:thiopurine S-methyltransferase [Thalassotalea crassostreae]
MESTFWHECWEKSHIGFHQDELQPLMVKYLPELIRPSDKRVFVPLCGKSSDLLFLAERFDVVGNELSDIACQDFFADNNLSVEVSFEKAFKCYQSAPHQNPHKHNISIYQGDFFELCPQQLASFDWIYDRAAIIALPKAMRKRYVDHLKSFIGNDTRLFLLTLEYPVDELTGPPFSVTGAEINELFAEFSIEKVTQRNLSGQKFARRNLNVSSLIESLFVIKR